MSDIYEVRFVHGGRGMFSIVNDLVDHLYVADKTGYKVKAYWEKSPYKTNPEEDAFSYYFEPFVEFAEDDKVVGEKKSFASRRGNLITPRKGGLAQPQQRSEVNKIIDKYISLKPNVSQKIHQFASANFGEYVIGLHIRGKGRMDGGAKRLRQRGELVDGVPYNLYFDKLDEHTSKVGKCKIFLCSDSQVVIEYCKNAYGDRIITYDATRSDGGEMHRSRKYRDQKYKLGEDVVAEAYLLSMCNYLIHGSSNVTNYVLCKNSELENFYIYGDNQ